MPDATIFYFQMVNSNPAFKIVIIADQFDFGFIEIARDGVNAWAGRYPLEIAVAIGVDPATPFPIWICLAHQVYVVIL